jgi:hypothetical protein
MKLQRGVACSCRPPETHKIRREPYPTRSRLPTPARSNPAAIPSAEAPGSWAPCAAPAPGDPTAAACRHETAPSPPDSTARRVPPTMPNGPEKGAAVDRPPRATSLSRPPRTPRQNLAAVHVAGLSQRNRSQGAEECSPCRRFVRPPQQGTRSPVIARVPGRAGGQKADSLQVQPGANVPVVPLIRF